MEIVTTDPIDYLDNLLANGSDIWEVAISIAQDDESEMTVRRWRQGDLSARVEKKYSENTLSKFAAAINVNTSTLRQRRNMALFYPPDTRAIGDNLGYSHYREAMKLGSLERAIWALEKCSAKDWPVFKLAKLLNRLIGKGKPKDILEGEITGVYIFDDEKVTIDIVVKDASWLMDGAKVTIKLK